MAKKKRRTKALGFGANSAPASAPRFKMPSKAKQADMLGGLMPWDIASSSDALSQFEALNPSNEDLRLMLSPKPSAKQLLQIRDAFIPLGIQHSYFNLYDTEVFEPRLFTEDYGSKSWPYEMRLALHLIKEDITPGLELKVWLNQLSEGRSGEETKNILVNAVKALALSQDPNDDDDY